MRLACLLALLIGLAAPAQAQPFTFAAFGDMPYRPEDETRVLELASEINHRRVDFTIFVGDTKTGREPCTEALLVERPRRIFDRFHHALIYTPGDNEWSDCLPRGAGELGPADALARLREAFFSGPTSYGALPIHLTRQSERFGTIENARWVHHNVVFATLNLPGVIRPDLTGRPLDSTLARMLPGIAAAAAVWVDESFAEARRRGARAVVLAFQADLWHPCNMMEDAACRSQELGSGAAPGTRFLPELPFDYARVLDRIAGGATTFGAPVLLLHGDSHRYLVRRNPSDGRGRSIPNATRIMVPGEDQIAALLIRVDPGRREPFAAEVVAPR